ncbi:hypothetical protein J4Q44_G00089310 [Coregonus suidteri]|uniref:Uncharacterized protein n=1 Tax=Coregonus suidteri TaxID=861788 RepID=A0AAN8M1E6_9TELE
MSEAPVKKLKISASRRLALKTKLLKKTGVMVVAEKEEERLEREHTLSERVPPLKFFGLALVDLQLLSHPTVPHSLVQPFLHLKGLRQEGKHGGCTETKRKVQDLLSPTIGVEDQIADCSWPDARG